MYKLTKNLQGTINGVKSQVGEHLICIPFDPANTDAVEFAKWLQEGNRPEPAEEDGAVTDEWIAETIAKLLPPDSQE